MDLRVLGPVEASVGGRPLSLGAVKQRALLAMLGLQANRTVSADRLMEGLWGEHPPASAAKLVQQHVSRLRRLLADANDDAEIVTRGRGYELRVAPEAVDVCRFERLLADGAARRALGLWRGPPLADVADEPFAAGEILRLEELRVTALEQAIDTDLADGRHADVVAELATLVAEYPLSERLAGQLMVALYRSGRQAEALAAYRQTRARLVQEIGVEPRPELRRLHEAMLRQDAALEAPIPAEVPDELEVTSPLVGRDAELERLRGAWARRRGGMIVVSGPDGMGCRRLVAELAAEVHREGALVFYGADGAEARGARRAALLVLDDVENLGAAELDEIARGPGPLLVVAITADASLAGRLPGVEHVALGPIGMDALSAIAALHAVAGVHIPVAELAQRSGGAPGRAHRLAAEWARAEAERRLRVAADRTAVERSDLSRGERELAGSVAELQAVRRRAERQTSGRAGVVCPFKGLSSFDVEDAEFFFGRERLVAELVARLVGSPLLGIVGPSGSGKSSALRAGLLASLAAGVLPGSERWALVLLRPGEHPMQSLEVAIARAGSSRRALIAVDQFEESFTLCHDAAERAVFADALAAPGEDRGSRAGVVVAVRADFYGRCAAYPELGRLLGANHVLVGPMQPDELRRAIELPAQQAGLRIDAALVDRLLADVGDAPGALPLLSSALLELWQRRDGRDLRLAAYERTGGVRGAVGRLAERAYERLLPQDRTLARGLLLRLTGDDMGGTPVRRRVSLEELGGGEDARRVLDALAGDRLVTITKGSAEVAHEALLREWPRLRAWLEEDAEGRLVHRNLIRAVREWSDGGRDRSELYRGSRLASALEWRAEHESELNPAEREFLDASRAASERARRRVQFALVGALALFAVATVAAVIALDGQSRARAQARAAEAQRIGVQALSEPALDRSLLLARQSVALDDTPATRDDLLAALRRSPAAIGVMRGDGDALNALALNPNGHTLAAGDYNGTVFFFDTRTGRALGPARQTGPGSTVSSLTFSRDGGRLVSAGADGDGGFVDLFDGHTGRYIRRLVGPQPFTPVQSVAFSPDSRLVVELNEYPDSPNRVLRVDARKEASPLDTDFPISGRGTTLLGFITPRTIMTSTPAGAALLIRDAATMRVIRRLPVPVLGARVALSPDRATVALGGRDGSVRLLDARTGHLRTAEGGHASPVAAMQFSADGRRLVTAGTDQRLIVWDTRRPAVLDTLQTGLGVVHALAIAPDARTAYSAGSDGTIVSWDLSGSRRFERPFSAGSAALAPGSLSRAERDTRFSAVDDQGFVDVFDSATLRPPDRIRVSSQQAPGAAIAPDGRTLVAPTAGALLGFWDVHTRRRLPTPLPTWSSPASSLTFSRDGHWLATGTDNSIVRLWDARHRTAVSTVSLAAVNDLSFNHDGTRLAVTLTDRHLAGGLEILSVPALAIVKTVSVPAGTWGRFSPSGRSLIYGDHTGRIWTIDTHTWRARGNPLVAHAGAIRTADLSPDGQLLVTTSNDGTARLWDVASRRPIGAALTGARGNVVGAAFMSQPGGLAVVNERGGYVWDVRPSSWERRACAVAGRTLTRAEWHNALPDRAYNPACMLH